MAGGISLFVRRIRRRLCYRIQPIRVVHLSRFGREWWRGSTVFPIPLRRACRPHGALLLSRRILSQQFGCHAGWHPKTGGLQFFKCEAEIHKSGRCGIAQNAESTGAANSLARRLRSSRCFVHKQQGAWMGSRQADSRELSHVGMSHGPADRSPDRFDLNRLQPCW